MSPFSLNINGRLLEYNTPAVMAILNVTPDSFYPGSRVMDYDSICDRVRKMVDEGADFIDIGAYSSRPGCDSVSEAEELDRLELGMKALRDVAPGIPVSVDTFRATVAEQAVRNLDVNIVNDISGGNMDANMIKTVGALQVPYVVMHMRGTPQTMGEFTEYENLLVDVFRELSNSIDRLHLEGVSDIIVDPGFGFSKTLEQNYMLLKHMDFFQLFHCPVLVGVSRKSMLTKLLNISAEEALEATTALNMSALHRGASILRVHDVKAAKQAVTIYNALQDS